MTIDHGPITVMTIGHNPHCVTCLHSGYFESFPHAEKNKLIMAQVWGTFTPLN
jgi:hypothetical protein